VLYVEVGLYGLVFYQLELVDFVFMFLLMSVSDGLEATLQLTR
jgi:hypothetical protein